MSGSDHLESGIGIGGGKSSRTFDGGLAVVPFEFEGSKVPVFFFHIVYLLLLRLA